MTQHGRFVRRGLATCLLGGLLLSSATAHVHFGPQERIDGRVDWFENLGGGAFGPEQVVYARFFGAACPPSPTWASSSPARG